MSKPQLTVGRLLSGGFAEVGCWELNEGGELSHRISLPTVAGVYAFGIDGVIQYVGLASTSVRQRLGFYRKPGTSQRTNIRLNELIREKLQRGAVVQILVAHPADHDWNGFRIKGAEGLEAGLIECFDLPWNMRGSSRADPRETPHRSRRGRRATGKLSDQILELVRSRPGITELEIAKAIYGPSAVQQQVNPDCRLLVRRGLLERWGQGGRSDPYTYRAKQI